MCQHNYTKRIHKYWWFLHLHRSTASRRKQNSSKSRNARKQFEIFAAAKKGVLFWQDCSNISKLLLSLPPSDFVVPKLLNVWPFWWTHCASDRRLLRRVIDTRRYSVHSSSLGLLTTSAGSIFGRAIVPHNYIWQNIRVHATILGRAIVEGNYVYLAEHCIGRRCRLGGTSEVEVAAASHIWQLVEELLTGLFIFNIIISIIFTIITSIIIFKPSPSS